MTICYVTAPKEVVEDCKEFYPDLLQFEMIVDYGKKGFGFFEVVGSFDHELEGEEIEFTINKTEGGYVILEGKKVIYEKS
jgi:hypothetical protein